MQVTQTRTFSQAQLSSQQKKLRSPMRSRAQIKVKASGKAISQDDVADINKRNIMNILTYGALGLNVVALGAPYVLSFVPILPPAGQGSIAKDKVGNEIYESKWLQTHKAGDKTLVQGLKGDVYYLLVTDDSKLEKFSVNAVCTHLGCVVPWNSAENKFKCPCHGSQYNNQGKVIRGPAPLSLALATTTITDRGLISLAPWKETDFRTGLQPWWK